ncbi:helix-turn-helix transcriptional regulator [Oleomonas cavernae]|uniref:Helix-turn-helix transcriptional regulator n=1 Tax=Oleomonas cavernae TaxID=2320859 RepID=A0A418W8U8_9PROT|nr:helix-turn-helix transcriptional regulator [Oleomonas cavernae]RJF86439.1 helix-turn-helix transcriptional regulator [Oleomonas cavernae]
MKVQNLYELVDQIYAAAWLPQRWTQVLNRLVAACGVQGCVLYIISGGSVRWIASEAVTPLVAEFVGDGWCRNNRWVTRAIAKQFPGFLGDGDLFTGAELESDPIYRDFLVPRGIHWTVGTTIQLPDGEIAIFQLVGDRTRPPLTSAELEILDTLRPHLARSAMVSARLPLIKAESATRTLEAMGLPAAAITSDGRIKFANSRFESLGKRITTYRTTGRISIANEAAAKLFETAMAGLGSGGTTETRSIPIRGDGEPPMVLHILPTRRESNEIFGDTGALIVVTAVGTPGAPPALLLQGLFDLTPAEARVAQSVAEGATLEELSDTLKVSRETLRTQLRMVFAKTGTKRQAELASLILGSVRFHAPDVSRKAKKQP